MLSLPSDPSIQLYLLLFSLLGIALGGGVTWALLWRHAVRPRDGALLESDQKLTLINDELGAVGNALTAANTERDMLRDTLERTLAESTERAEQVIARDTEISDHRVTIERLQATLEAERRAHTEKLEELEKVRLQIETDLKAKMGDLLDVSSAKFLERAQSVLKQQAEKGETGVKTLVDPMREALATFQKQVTEMETRRKQDEGALAQQIRHISESHSKLNDTTVSLVNALRTAPKTRGRWGENQLRNLLEMAGMAEYTDFKTEVSVNTESGQVRPDAVLTMPGGRTLVIDAKTSMSAYWEAMEADQDELREAKLREHAKQVRVQADGLGKKEYWKTLPTADTVDFVIMFVPGEPFYAAAMARDPDLFEDAWAKRVIICSPTTLLALARAIAFGWRQERASKDAQKIQEVATELYKRMVKLGNGVASVSKSLRSHVNKHNELIGSLEGSVLPQARKMSELGIGDSLGSIEEPAQIEEEVRYPKMNRDLEFSDDAKKQLGFYD